MTPPPAMRPGRDHAYRQARARVLAGATLCSLCGEPLDLDAAPRSPMAPSADHILPVSMLAGLDPKTAQQLAADPAGLRPAHVSCNASRGAGRKRRRHVSRSW
jgi:hypothetical protein